MKRIVSTTRKNWMKNDLIEGIPKCTRRGSRPHKQRKEHF
jgi:hypothetical protein